MEVAALGAANWALGKVLNKLSDEFLAAWAASEKLGDNYNTIMTELLYTQGMLHKAEERNVSNNPGLAALLLQLAQVADDADDVLDVMDYFRIRDGLERTQITASEVSGLRGACIHGKHAVQEVLRKWFSCCCRSDENGKPLTFHRVEVSNRFGCLAQQLPPLCAKVSTILNLELLDGLKKPNTEEASQGTGSVRHNPSTSASTGWAHEIDEDEINLQDKHIYDQLSFHLKQCLLYSALFREGYQFSGLELVTLWVSTGILDHLSGRTKRIEAVGYKYLGALVGSGVFRQITRSIYIINISFHKLARQLSSHKFHCLDYYTDERPVDIPLSICHLSIFIPSEEESSKYSINKWKGAFLEDMDKLKNELDIRKLRTLMIFGDYDREYAKVLQDTFKEMESVRILRLSENSLEYLPPNFPRLQHLRCLSIKASSCSQMSLTDDLLITISGFYHLKVLDLDGWEGCLPKIFNRLVNLRHFISSPKAHSTVSDVGKLKFLQNLEMFEVKKVDSGFELEELGRLTDLGGTLTICNLEKIKTRDKASKAKLDSKRNLTGLRLSWSEGTEPSNTKEAEEALEGLRPNTLLSELHIKDHQGSKCPSWLEQTKLRLLHLNGVSWNRLPLLSMMPLLEELKLKNVNALEYLNTIVAYNMEIKIPCFEKLKVLKIYDMQNLKQWAFVRCSFPCLEELRIVDCENLTTARLESTERDMPTSKCYPILRKLYISSCPSLFMPPMPCTPTLQFVTVDNSEEDKLEYSDNRLTLRGKNLKLEYPNLGNLKQLTFEKASPVLSKHFKMLTSLQELEFRDCSSVLEEEADINDLSFPAVKSLILERCEATEKELKRLLDCFHNLSTLMLKTCPNVKRLCMAQELDREAAGSVQLPSLEVLKLTGLDRAEFYFSDLIKISRLKSISIVDCTFVKFQHGRKWSTPVLEEIEVFNSNDQESIAADIVQVLSDRPQELLTISVDSVSGLLSQRDHFFDHVTTIIFCFDHKVQIFTPDQNTLLGRLENLQSLEFSYCKHLESLPESLPWMWKLESLVIKNCPLIKRLPGIPGSLQKLYIQNCSVELEEECRKLQPDKLPSLQILGDLRPEV